MTALKILQILVVLGSLEPEVIFCLPPQRIHWFSKVAYGKNIYDIKCKFKVHTFENAKQLT